jgi:membrane protein
MTAMNIKRIRSMLGRTFHDWQEDKASRLAASLAYYTLLSLAPLLIVVVSIAGWVFGDEAARGQLSSQLVAVVGPQAAPAVESILANARAPSAGLLGTIIGVVVLLFGASGVFGELQEALDTVWEVVPKPGRGVMGILKDRFFSFTMVLGVAFLLLVSLVISTALAAIGARLGQALPGGAALWHVVNFAVSFVTTAVLFALIFKVIPDVKISWRDVWVGGAITALLFTIGRALLGLYLGRSSMASPYGAAGSLVVLVVWVYYSAQILFLGAEFTQVYAQTFGSRIQPADNAVRIAKGEPGVPAEASKAPAPTGRTAAPSTKGAVATKRHAISR